MRIIAAPDRRRMPYGLDSVADIVTQDREAVNGFQYITECSGSVGTTSSPCNSLGAALNGLVLTLDTSSINPVHLPWYEVNWGDGTAVEALTENAEHTYAVDGQYTVSITGVGGDYQVVVDTVAATAVVTSSLKSATGGLVTVTSTTVTLYTETVCKAVGMDRGYNAAVEAMNAGQSHAMEQVLGLMAPPATAVADPATALESALTDWFAQTPDAPIIHVSAANLHRLRDIHRHGNHLEADAGPWVSAGTGYPTQTIILSGPVVAYQAAMMTHEVFTPETNEVTQFAERPVSLTAGCAPLVAYAWPVD